ncbi:MAG: hypothetical protein ACRDIV_17905 [Ktedonobacteraceae bacterium]
MITGGPEWTQPPRERKAAFPWSAVLSSLSAVACLLLILAAVRSAALAALLFVLLAFLFLLAAYLVRRTRPGGSALSMRKDHHD